MPEIVQRIEAGQLYKFHSSNPTQIVYQGIRRYCKGMKAPDHAPVDLFDRFTGSAVIAKYFTDILNNRCKLATLGKGLIY